MPTPLNILIIEDSQDDALLLTLELRNAGFEPRWQRVEAESDFRANLNPQLDIIFSDFSLPRFSTQRALKILRERDLRIPFVIVSGTIGEENAVECIKMGADDYLVKDRLARLGSAVRLQLDQRHLREENRRAELALQQAQKRLTHVVASSPAATYLIEIQGEHYHPVWISDNITLLTGYSTEEALGSGWWTTQIHPDDKARAEEEMASLPSTGHIVQEYKFRRKDGAYIWIRDEKRLLRDEAGAPVQVVGSWSDITERKSLEAQLRQAQKMELLGQLAGSVAHDFNNVLAVVHGHASLILSTEGLDKDTLDSAEQIAMAAERATGLSRQLLTFSRKQVLQPQILDLNDAIKALSKLLTRMLGENVALAFNPAPGLPVLQADIVMVEQVLMNMAINARDAMPNGGKFIVATSDYLVDDATREMNPEVAPGRYVCLSLSDTGCGIPSEVLPHIFEPFFTTKEPGKGTGLGLATVYGIVKQHGGWIKVYSEPGKGTVFRIYLPAATGVSKAAEISGKISEAPGGSETILIAEDEAPLRKMAHNIMERLGYRVFEADSGPAALKVWNEHKDEIDLLFTDMIMPGRITGKALAEQMRSEKPSLKAIYTSAYSVEMLDKDFIATEGMNFIQKPYSIHKLLKFVREVLDRKSAS